MTALSLLDSLLLVIISVSFSPIMYQLKKCKEQLDTLIKINKNIMNEQKKNQPQIDRVFFSAEKNELLIEEIYNKLYKTGFRK